MNYEFPNQNIPEEKKNNLKFHQDHIYAFLAHSSTAAYKERQDEIVELSYAIVAKSSPKHKKIIEKTLTQQYGEDLQVPWVEYPLIEQKLEDAIGKYRLRPLRSKTGTINRTAVNSKFEKLVDGIAEAFQRQLNTEIQDESGIEIESENPDMEVPELEQKSIQEFMGNYRTENEKIGESILDFLLYSKNEKEKVYTALMFYLGFGDVGFFIDEKNGNPTIHIPHTLEYFTDIAPTQDIHDDVEILGLDQWYSENEILNKFDLTEKEKKQLHEFFVNDSAAEVKIGNSLSFPGNTFVRDINGIKKCRTVSLYWKSRKKLEFKSYENKKTKKKESRKITDKLSDKDKKRIIDKDELDVVEVENIRHITMIGQDLVLSWGSLKDQITSAGDPRKRFIPFVRITSDNPLRTGETRSMARKLKFLQDLASELLWELRFNMRQMDGNALVYDVSMFPKELFGSINSNDPKRAVNKVMRLLKKDRIMFINSKDKRSNHYASSVNVSQKGRIQDLVMTFELIEKLADKISGLPSQNANQVYQKATTAEIQAQNTTSRLEEYFGPFESGLERVFNYMIAKGQQLYKENEIISYIGGDEAQKFIQISQDFANDDLGVKFVNNRKDYESKNAIDQIAARMMSTTDDLNILMGMLDVLDSENYEEARTLLERTAKHVEEMKKEAEEAQQAQQQAIIDQQKEQLASDKEEKEKDRINNKEVALIYANNKADSDRIKEENANLRKAADIEVKNKELDNKKSSEDSKNSKKSE